MDRPVLTPSHIPLAGQKRKNRRNTVLSRAGFVDENKQVFLPPKSMKRLEHWKKEMGIA